MGSGRSRAAVRAAYDRILGPLDLPGSVRPAFRSLGARTIAIDCGANRGDITAHMAARGAEVYAFEPNPYVFPVLAERFADNPRVHCLQQGVAAQAGAPRLYLHVNAKSDQIYWSTGSSLFAEKPNADPSSWVAIETIDLDGFIAELAGRVSLLKLDVEGVEIEIMERMLETGRLLEIRHVLVEMHDGRIPSLSERGRALRSRLADRRFRHVQLDWV
jgi:FkbM family methyltransferase